jgi:hypothetical protein
VLVLALLPFCGLLAATASLVLSVRDKDFPVEVFPAIADLGSIVPGTRREFSVLLRNQTKDVVVIETVSVSCPCLRCASSLLLWPNRDTSLDLVAELSKDLEFYGPLTIEVKAWTKLNELAFIIVVELEVSHS